MGEGVDGRCLVICGAVVDFVEREEDRRSISSVYEFLESLVFILFNYV